MLKSIYIPNWKLPWQGVLTAAQLDALVGINRFYYAFCQFNTDGSLKDVDASAIKLFVQNAKSTVSGREVVLSFGGWGADFSGIKYHPTEAAGAAAWLVRETGADGVDIDWEYPLDSDCESYQQFITSYRGLSDKLLTAAVAATPKQKLFNQFDTLNLMTYDFAGSWCSVSGHNTSIKQIKESAESWLAAGFDAKRICVGIPFYGRRVEVASTAKNGLAQPVAAAGWWEEMTYSQISMLGGDHIQQWDSTAGAPYKWNLTQQKFTTYTDKYVIKTVQEYASARGLQGMFAWCFGQDDSDYTLTKALATSV